MRNDERIDDSPYNITITAVIYTPDAGETVHRGLNFKVLQAMHQSALAEVQGGDSDSWEVVRTPELFMNGPFMDFENRIMEVFQSPPINRQASFTIRRPAMLPRPQIDKVRRVYMESKGFTADNVPWRDLAKYYTEGSPVDRQMFRNITGIDNTKTGFGGDFRKEGPGLDGELTSKFSPEELAAAEKSVEILEGVVTPKTKKKLKGLS